MRLFTFASTLVLVAACGSSADEIARSPVAPTQTSSPTEPTPSAPDASVDAPAPSSCDTPLVGKVSLPADDSAHPAQPMEWWYWTGHLQTADGRWFGFEEVFFRALVGGLPGHMVHSAITDIDGNTFHHFSTVGPGELAATPNGYDFSASGHSVKGGNGHDALVASGLGYSFSLTADAAKRPTLQHGDGYTDYSFGGNTYYYSRERMTAQGTLTIGSAVYPVKGTAWFDHQYGDIRAAVNNGWDWFAFQLDHGREMMLFVVRVKGAQVLVGASVTGKDCVTIEVPPSDVAVTALGTWKSPHTTCSYPSAWRVKVGAETFLVTPYVADQEVYTSTPIYWEGASKIVRETDHQAVGRAYVELSGYCPPLN